MGRQCQTPTFTMNLYVDFETSILTSTLDTWLRLVTPTPPTPDSDSLLRLLQFLTGDLGEGHCDYCDYCDCDCDCYLGKVKSILWLGLEFDNNVISYKPTTQLITCMCLSVRHAALLLSSGGPGGRIVWQVSLICFQDRQFLLITWQIEGCIILDVRFGSQN